MLKYGIKDIRVYWKGLAPERQPCAFVGSVATMLSHFGIRLFSHVRSIGSIECKADFQKIIDMRGKIPVRCIDQEAERQIKAIDDTAIAGDSLGRVFEVITINVPVEKEPCPLGQKVDGQLLNHL